MFRDGCGPLASSRGSRGPGRRGRHGGGEVFGRHGLAAGVAIAAFASVPVAMASGADGPGGDRLSQVDHIVVIYQENHSFDNLYGGWEAVRGLSSADAAHTTQVSQTGTPFSCLMQNDVN